MPTRPLTLPLSVCVDPGEPWPHPWRHWLPAGVSMERRKLEFGRLALAGYLDGASIDRRTISDMLVAIGPERAAFEMMLRHCRGAGRFVVVVEGTFEDLIDLAPKIRPNSIIGTLAAWSRRYCPFQFCGSRELAASFGLRFLLQPYFEDRDAARAAERAGSAALARHPHESPTKA